MQSKKERQIKCLSEKVRALMELGKSEAQVMSELSMCQESYDFYRLIVISQYETAQEVTI